MKLKDKVAIVTGGSQGIGEAISVRYAAEGAKVAIVSDKPQTTRTRILGVRNYPDAQVVFLDTPGIHRPLHRMNVRMVDTAVDTIRSVDVLGLVVDANVDVKNVFKSSGPSLLPRGKFGPRLAALELPGTK